MTAQPSNFNITTTSKPFHNCFFRRNDTVAYWFYYCKLVKMGATALNAMFTSLGTANGSQTITVTGNPGAATCDTSIATNKGFTVVVS